MTDEHSANLPAPVQSALDTYRYSVRARDVDAFMALYHHSVRVFDTWGVWSFDGSDALRGNIEGWFASLGTDHVVVSFDDVRTIVAPELMVVSAMASYAGVSKEGVELRSMQNRLTWALRLEGCDWKIVHEHTSVPVGSDGKGILRREG